MRPQEDNYPEVLEATMAAICRHGVEAGAEALAPIGYSRRDLPPRPSMPRRIAIEVFRRDHFLCRYCDGRTIFQAPGSSCTSA